MSSPCENCYIRFGKRYSADCDLDCNYAIAVLALKEIKEHLENLLDTPEMKIKTEVRDLIDQVDQYPINLESCG